VLPTATMIFSIGAESSRKAGRCSRLDTPEPEKRKDPPW
jgi:hypothetical protein